MENCSKHNLVFTCNFSVAFATQADSLHIIWCYPEVTLPLKQCFLHHHICSDLCLKLHTPHFLRPVHFVEVWKDLQKKKNKNRNVCWPFSFVLHRHFKMPQNGAIPVATGMRRPQCCCYRRHGHASIPLPARGWMRPRVSHRGPGPLVPGEDAADSFFCSVNSLATRKSQCPTSLPQHFHPLIPQHCEKMNLSCSETVLEAAILQLSCLWQS